MKKNTKKIVTAAGIAAGTAAVASLSAYVTIKALIDTALDREMPKVMEKADKRISGEKSSDEFTNRMESARSMPWRRWRNTAPPRAAFWPCAV